MTPFRSCGELMTALFMTAAAICPFKLDDVKQSACYVHTLHARSHSDPCCRLTFKHSEPWDASLETNLKLALSNPGPSHSQDHKELRSAVLFRGVSVAPYFTQLLVALASGTSISDVSRSLQRADCLACSFFSDLLTGLSQTWCGCSAVYGERVVIKSLINSISLSVTQHEMRVPGGCPLVGLSKLQAVLLAVQLALYY
jgi:hypothetical protein